MTRLLAFCQGGPLAASEEVFKDVGAGKVILVPCPELMATHAGNASEVCPCEKVCCCNSEICCHVAAAAVTTGYHWFGKPKPS